MQNPGKHDKLLWTEPISRHYQTSTKSLLSYGRVHCTLIRGHSYSCNFVKELVVRVSPLQIKRDRRGFPDSCWVIHKGLLSLWHTCELLLIKVPIKGEQTICCSISMDHYCNYRPHVSHMEVVGRVLSITQQQHAKTRMLIYPHNPYYLNDQWEEINVMYWSKSSFLLLLVTYRSNMSKIQVL